jgi:23S rRNA (guanosine2251-2'-O)-methyltransferase
VAPTRKTEIKRFMRQQERPKRELAFLLQDVQDPVNVGSAFRIADAAKAQVVLTGITAQPEHKVVQKVGRGKHQRVPWRYFETIQAAAAALVAEGFTIYAVEITEQAQPYHLVPYPPKTCLMVGHEDHGVTRAALALAQETVFIPMYGKGASLNVHVALGITAFHALHHDMG